MKAMFLLAGLALAMPELATAADVKTINLPDGIHPTPIDIVGDDNTRVIIVGNEKTPRGW